MEEILIEEKKYISSKQAAKLTGYAKDYIGQLCREGRVPARLVGRSWYVLESAIQDHRFGASLMENKIEETPEAKKPTVDSTWEFPRYEPSSADILPSVNRLRASHREETVDNKEPEVEQQTIQDSWKNWFERFDHVINIEKKVPEKDDTEEKSIEVRIEKKDDVNVPIHMLQYPRKNQKPIAQEMKEYLENESNDVPPSRTTGGRTRSVLMGMALLIMVVILSLDVIASGYIDKYIDTITQAQYMAGITVYNK